MKRKTRYFTPEEARKIIDRANASSHYAFLIGFATGIRVGELLAMKPYHWKFDQGFVEIYDSKKSGQIRQVPFLEREGRAVKRWLEMLDLKPLDQIFPLSARTYNRWTKDAAKKAGAVWNSETHNCRWHSWRGSYVRYQRNVMGKSDKFLMQATGDSLEVLLGYYEELTVQDMVKIHREGE